MNKPQNFPIDISRCGGLPYHTVVSEPTGFAAALVEESTESLDSCVGLKVSGSKLSHTKVGDRKRKKYI